jgi:hypothetical protein
MKTQHSVATARQIIILDREFLLRLCLARAKEITEAGRLPAGLQFFNAITNALCTSFKEEALQGIHLSGATYNMALYTSAATLGAATTAYTASNEVANGNGYTTTGQAMSGYAHSSSGTTAWLTWSSPVRWSSATITARGALIYNATLAGKNAVAVLDFGQDYTSTNGNFDVNLPTADASNAIVRIA